MSDRRDYLPRLENSPYSHGQSLDLTENHFGFQKEPLPLSKCCPTTATAAAPNSSGLSFSEAKSRLISMANTRHAFGATQRSGHFSKSFEEVERVGGTIKDRRPVRAVRKEERVEMKDVEVKRHHHRSQDTKTILLLEETTTIATTTTRRTDLLAIEIATSAEWSPRTTLPAHRNKTTTPTETMAELGPTTTRCIANAVNSLSKKPPARLPRTPVASSSPAVNPVRSNATFSNGATLSTLETDNNTNHERRNHYTWVPSVGSSSNIAIGTWTTTTERETLTRTSQNVTVTFGHR